MIAKALLPEFWTEILVPVCAIVGIVFSLFQWHIVPCVKLTHYLIEEEEEGVTDHNVVAKCAEIQTAISEGATSFLFTEYKYVGVFMVIFAALSLPLFCCPVEGFSTKTQPCCRFLGLQAIEPCTYDRTRTCKPALCKMLRIHAEPELRPT